MANETLTQLRETKKNKLAALYAKGIDPYPAKSLRTHSISQLKSDYESFEGQHVVVSGRIFSIRKQGGLTFITIGDELAEIQLFIQKKALTDGLEYTDLGLLDRGDIIQCSGIFKKTQRGEMSVFADAAIILSKSLRPLPDKYQGLKDRETIVRKRYLEGSIDFDVRERYRKIALMISEIRRYLEARDFIEIPTPVIQPQYGGGTAKPFRTMVSALGEEMYLSISHELYLKKLIISGYERVYTIGRYFRNEGIDHSHHPEFMMVETMAAYQDYTFSMDLVEGMFKNIAANVFGKTQFKVRDEIVEFSGKWKRISMVDAVKEVTGIDFLAIKTIDAANDILLQLNISEQADSVGHALVIVFEYFVESTLINPTLVYGHPIEISPLAKPMRDDPRFTERFEIFIGGMECGDNWSEQNDPQKLLSTWKLSHNTEKLDEGECHSLDFDFIEALEYGMPPTTGIGPGIERMAMIFLEKDHIDDVIFFPLRRKKVSKANAIIYDI